MKTKTIKIVHILEGFVGGLKTYICNVLPQMTKEGFDVTLICSLNRCCPDAKEHISLLRQSGVTVHVIAMQRKINLFHDFHSFLIISRLLRTNNFDIVHTHCSKAGALGRIAAALAGTKAIMHSPHCFYFLRCQNKLKSKFYIFLEKLFGIITTYLVVVSKSGIKVATDRKIVPPDKCVYIPNCLSVNNTSDELQYDINADKHMVLTACRLVEYKGIIRFIEAARLSKSPNTLFLIAGEGKYADIANKYIHENNLTEKVRLLGYVSNMESLYARSDIITLCSEAEGQPYLLLEAMRAKRPIVATDVTGTNELISHNKTGLLTKPTPASIAKAIDHLLKDKDKAKRLTERAYEYFCKHHSLERQISLLATLYNNSVYNRKGENATEI